MKIFLYSSPYLYYVENLIPLAQYFIEQGHEVYGSYRLSDTGDEYSMLDNDKSKNSKVFLKGKLDVDVVILTQPWWYRDNLIAKYCNDKGIKFYIVDHAPPMIKYTQKDGKKSHLYRSDGLGARCYFAYGQATSDIMKQVGYKGNIYISGSSRIEKMILEQQDNKKGSVVFDTSNRIEDNKLLNKFIEFSQNHKDEQFFIHEHSRSPNVYRKALKYDNVSLIKNISESRLFEYSKFIYTFPSSAMLVPALLNKKMYSLYDEHFCLEAREYHKKYEQCIFSINENK